MSKTVGPDWPKFCILGEILVNILLHVESLKSFENIIKFLFVQMSNPSWNAELPSFIDLKL